MKLSKTPPINQACQRIDFPSSLPSSLSLPASLHPGASDVSRCKTNVAQRVKARSDPQLHNISPLFSPPPRSSLRLNSGVDGVQTGLPPPTPSTPTPLDGGAQLPPPSIYMGLTPFPVMKYSQVTGSLRNDGGQSIAFQRVIFSPSDGPARRVDSH